MRLLKKTSLNIGQTHLGWAWSSNIDIDIYNLLTKRGQKDPHILALSGALLHNRNVLPALNM